MCSVLEVDIDFFCVHLIKNVVKKFRVIKYIRQLWEDVRYLTCSEFYCPWES